MSIIEQRYREGCKQLGISPSLNFTRAAKYEELHSKIKKETIIQEKDEGTKEKKLEETYDAELPKEVFDFLLFICFSLFLCYFFYIKLLNY